MTDEWPSFRRPITGQLYTEPCRCPHCLQRELDRHTHEYEKGAAEAPPPPEETP